MLGRCGLRPRIFPVFSNIDVSSFSPDQTGDPEVFTILLFGRIPRNSISPAQVNGALAEARAAGLRPRIVAVGEPAHARAGWNEVVCLADGVDCVCLGAQPAVEVSRRLAGARLGLSVTPLALWSKSSACAAMETHGLRIVFSDATEPAEGPLPRRYALSGETRLRMRDASADRLIADARPEAVWRAMVDAVWR